MERIVENMRQVLCSNRAFEPTFVFNKIANSSLPQLKAEKIFDLVSKFSTLKEDQVNIEQCHLLVKNWERKNE